MLIHVCCADCFLKLYESLENKDNLTLFFYNPNLHPREEYYARLRALKKVLSMIEEKDGNKIKLIVPNYKPQEYFDVQGLKRDKTLDEGLLRIPNKKERCPKCWYLRLAAVFKYASENDFKTVSSTLFSSSYQNMEKIKDIAETLARKYQVEFYLPDQKKIDKYQATCGFYKQNYCGCLFSLAEKVRGKFDF